MQQVPISERETRNAQRGIQRRNAPHLVCSALSRLIVFFAFVASLARADVVIPTNSVWSFFRGTNEASQPNPTEWRTNTFDDSSWEVGQAPFYFGFSPTNGTLLSDMLSNYTCIFLRQSFVLTNAQSAIGMSNRAYADDGFIIWLNGIPLRAFAMPGGATVGTNTFYPYNTNASGGFFSAAWSSLNSFTNLLRNGTNVFAMQGFNRVKEDLDYFANPELAIVFADITAPVVTSVSPSPSTTVTNLAQLTIVFSESVSNVDASDLRINGAPASSVTVTNGTNYAFRFPTASAGIVQVTWDPGHGIKDFSNNPLNTTNVSYYFTNIVEAPRVVSATPAFGATVPALTSISVVFNKPVSGMTFDDLLVNGQPATALTGSNTTYTFTFPAPTANFVQISWDPNHLIVDDIGIRMNEASNTWTYTIVDTIAPTVASLTPASNAIVGSLAQVEVLFSESVLGIDAADLLINGASAASAFGSGAGPYTFQFTQPANGVVTLSWAAGHNIRDTATPANAFAGGSWTVTLDPAQFTGDVIINEFAAGNYVTNAFGGVTNDIDEFSHAEDWIELYNRGTNPVRLLGWSLSNDENVPALWTFPDVTLTNGKYLVVYASGLDRRILGGTNRLHTNFKLNPFGSYLALFNAEFPKRAVTEFAPEFPEQRNDYTYGLINSNTWRYFATPTPGFANGTSALTNLLPKPKVNVSRGYFETPFTLVAIDDDPSATLRYTTDGSDPTTTTNTITYTGPFVVSNTLVLRMAAFASNALPSRVASHTYINLSQVLLQPNNPSGYPTGTTVWAGYPSDYEMDPEIVTNALFGPQLKDAFKALPVVCLSMRVGDLFDPTTGIYTHPTSRGPQWERPVSMEFFAPDGSEEELQVDAAIQIQGNAARDPQKQPKHPLKVQFKGDYGPGNLDYKIFHDSPREEFDSVNLRADFNFSWLHWDGANQRARGQRTRDSWCKDTMREMGNLASHNRYTHLFINGLYWGIYDPTERPDGSFAAAYLGGEKEEFDVINEGAAIDGTITAYNAMIGIRGLTNIAQYDAMKQYLGMTQFIDYMLLHFYVGHEDWGLNKNWYTFRRKFGGDTFKYVPWDQENILSASTTYNRVSNTDVPSTLHTNLVLSSQYRLDFADRVHKHFFNNGALMPSNVITRWMNRAQQVDLPIICESARWGDYRRDVHVYQTAPYELYTKTNQWIAEQNRLVGTYFPQRTDIVLAQLRAANLYPSNTAPVFNQHGGRVAPGFGLTMSATNTIYYTLNGTDPRTYGSGTISPIAQVYSAPVTLSQSVVVKARMLAGTNWSALTEATFAVGSLIVPLRITELMYNPIGGDAFEFLELQNTGPTALDIGNYSFTNINFSFPFGYVLAAGQRILLGNNANTNAFKTRYPGVTVAGWFGGSLANGGETIAIRDGAGRIVFSVSYDDEGGWATAPDGGGYSLEIIDPNGDPNAPANWRASAAQNGTPRQPNSFFASPAVILNEVMADNPAAVNHEGTYPDWVELYNGTATNVSLTGWSLTDNGSPRQFVFPEGTTIPAGGYLVVWCDATTNTTSGFHSGFALGRNGDSVFLYDQNTNRVDAISFGPQVANYSIGRVSGAWTLTVPTTNAMNQVAALAPATALSINEWLANSAAGADDWVELFNSSATLPVSLRNIYVGTSNALWQLQSLSYLGARGYLQLHADENPGPDHLNFKLPAGAGTIALYDAAGAEVQRVNYGPQLESVSQGRLPDGNTTIVFFPGSVSPGSSNYVLNYTGPVLNELLARNSSAVAGPWGNYPDYLEIYNGSLTAFNLGGFGLSDDAGKVKFVFAPGTTVNANSYVLVWCDGERAVSTNGTLNSGFSLSGSSGGAYLFNTNGQVVNQIEYGFQVQDRPIGRSTGQWQLLSSATPGATNAAPASLGSAANLRVNEWMANPKDGDDWFELYNLDASPVNMSGLFLTDDPTLAGLSNTPIAGLSFIGGNDWVKWIADEQPSKGRNHTRFDLDKDGDTIRIYAADFSIIDSLTFGSQLDGVSQGRLPDGGTNVVSFPTTPTPEESNYLPLQDVVINEALTHTDPPFEDAIEIQNVGTNTITIGDWFISNSQSALKKFRVPSGLSLAPGVFRVFYETQFNAGGAPTNFTLNSAHGDSIYLSQADGAGNLSGYRAQVSFGAAENAVSFGRFVTSVGADFVAMEQHTFGVDSPATVEDFRGGTGLSNSYPKIGPLIINEIHYHPNNAGLEIADEEFVEFYNTTGSPVPMFDAARPTNVWKLSGGVSFSFSSNVTLAANGYLLLVNFDPATNALAAASFRARYGTNGTLIGPLKGRLSNSGDELALYRPDNPQQAPHPDVGFVPMILVDRVVYDEATNAWPASASADGGGASLQRIAPNLYGNEPLNWKGEPPTAGSTNEQGAAVAPTISGQPTNQMVVLGGTATFVVNANGTPPLNYQWQHAGTNLPGANSAILTIVNVQTNDAGSYRVVVSNSVNSITSEDATLSVLVPPSISLQPQSKTNIAGDTVIFTVMASGSGTLLYQWRRNGTDLIGQNSSQLTLNNVQPVNEGNYTVVVTNSAGSITSMVASLTVLVPPTITGDPADVTVMDGDPVTFTVSATGTAPLSYQWRKDNVNIPGANGTSYSIMSAHASDAGFYSCFVTNVAGNATSLSAELRVSSQSFLSEPRLRGDGAFEFKLNGQSNRTYMVEFTENFGGWTNVTNITLTSPQGIVVDGGATNASSRFYRVHVQP
jgi:hypothetical protein